MTLDISTIHSLVKDKNLNESAIVSQALRISQRRVQESQGSSYVDEGVKDLIKKGLAKVKDIGDKVKNFITDKIDKIASWIKDKVFEPLQKHLTSKFVPGFKWGSNKNDADGLLVDVMTLMEEKKILESESNNRRYIKSDVMLERSGIVGRESRQSFLNDYRSWVVNEHRRMRESSRTQSEFPARLQEAGAIGAVMAAIHWSHFAVDILEMVLQIAPSIPFLAGIVSKLKGVENNPKLKGLVEWYNKHKVIINSVCITIGIVEFVLFGGAVTIITTALSAGWWAGEVIWHHFSKHDKEAKDVAAAEA
jgi:hypothetical protein